MRFADVLKRVAVIGVAAAAAATTAGCAMLPFGSSRSDDKPVNPPTVVTPSKGAPAAATPPAAAAAQPPAAAAAQPPKVETPPVDPAVERAYMAARAALLAGRVDEAERGFSALAKSHPELGGAHANLGIVYRRANKLAESVAALERAVATNPKQPVYLNQLGISYRMSGQFERARETYEKAIEADPNYALAYLNLGILFDMYLWDSARALELYDRYLALSPAGDDKVRKWAADIRNRKPQKLASRKEER